MAKRYRYLVAYDISSQKKRTKLAKKLLNHGFRLQRSVFEIEISQVDLGDLQHFFENNLGKSDSILILEMGQFGVDKMQRIGHTPNYFEDEDLFFV